jgi:hypothetical protein
MEEIANGTVASNLAGSVMGEEVDLKKVGNAYS